jgi:hypothetical protein
MESALVSCRLSLPTTRIIRWLVALQQLAISGFCARPTWTLSDPTYCPAYPKAALTYLIRQSETPFQRVFCHLRVGFRQVAPLLI